MFSWWLTLISLLGELVAHLFSHSWYALEGGEVCVRGKCLQSPVRPSNGFVLPLPLSKDDPRNHTKWARGNISCGFVDRITGQEISKQGTTNNPLLIRLPTFSRVSAQTNLHSHPAPAWRPRREIRDRRPGS